MMNRNLVNAKAYLVRLANKIFYAWNHCENELTLQEVIEHAASHALYMEDEIKNFRFRMDASYSVTYDTLSFIVRCTKPDEFSSIATLYIEDLNVDSKMIVDIESGDVSIGYEENGSFKVEHFEIEK